MRRGPRFAQGCGQRREGGFAMRKDVWVMGALAAAWLALPGAGPAAAQSCAELVERFAADNSLSASPPPTAAPNAQSGAGTGTAGSATANNGTVGDGASGSAGSERLAQSGGVIAPPPSVGDQAVIEPPRGGAGSSNMPTAPSIRPDTGPTTDSPTGGAMGRAAQNAQMESLITAARSAADQGDEAQCMESLAKARRLSQSAPGGAGGGGG